MSRSRPKIYFVLGLDFGLGRDKNTMLGQTITNTTTIPYLLWMLCIGRKALQRRHSGLLLYATCRLLLYLKY